GYDIIFFWIIRMVFSSIEQMGEVPFKDIFLTGLVLDSKGRKMSKSLGNGIDPLEVIDSYGADALRFTLVTGNSPGNDMRFYDERVESSRNFANKLWNATRFVLMNLDVDVATKAFKIEELQEEDKWILSKLNTTIGDVKNNLDKYELGLAAQRVYDFIWEEYCDWYIEMVKSRLYGEDEKSKELAQKVLLYVLKDINRLLHPFMPFITEEIWSHLPGGNEPLILSKWPKVREDFKFEEAQGDIEYIKTAIKNIRNARLEMDIAPSKKSTIVFVTKNTHIEDIINKGERYFKNLASAEDVLVQSSKEGLDGENIAVVLDKAEAFLPLKDLIDFEKEMERLQKEKEKLQDELKRVTSKLSNEGFISKAPEKIINGEKAKKEKYESMMEKVLERIENIKNNI
ncbi:MAG: class I tRNA ligase family protein, partial [Tissierella sp.]|uniref:class I tRNA ligase family protein n=1 Tax=Tissierella sp. TaxID=41274 RepID=UPI003F99462A